MSFKHEKIHYSSIATMLLGFIILGVFAYQSFFPVKVWELMTPPVVVGDSFRAGETIPIQLDICKYKNISGSMVVQYVDGVIYTTPTVFASTEVGCQNVISYTNIVPNLPAGEYYLVITWTHKVNAFRTTEAGYRTDMFKIIK